MNHKKFHADGFHKATGAATLNAHGGGHHHAGGSPHSLTSGGGGGGARRYRRGGYGGYGGYGYMYPYPAQYVILDTPASPEELADNQKPLNVEPAEPKKEVPAADKKPSIASSMSASEPKYAESTVSMHTTILLVGAAIGVTALFVLMRTKKIV